MQINVLEYLEEGALARFRDRTAVECAGAICTFAQLQGLALQCASALCRYSERTTAPVCVYLPKGIETIVADLGILYSRNCYSNLDVKSPGARVKAILDNLRPLAIITSSEHQETLIHLGVLADQLILIDGVLEAAAAPDQESLSRRRAKALDTDPVCIINTSGSTGIPKSVAMNHRNIIDFIDWTLDEFDFNEHDVMGSLSPFYFDIYTLELYVSLATGACISIIPENLAAFPPKVLGHLVEKNVSFIFWVPSIMVNIANLGLLEEIELKTLRRVFFAGEVFPTRQFNRWKRNLSDAEFVNLYGPIEITVDCTFYRVTREFADDEPLPIGFPCRNTEIMVLTDENRLAAIGEQGELAVKGSSLAMGYWNSPSRTDAAFVQNPLNSSYPERIYRTGDIAYWNERGELIFVGRRDYQIKHMGYRIELGEIEAAVASTGLVDSACVIYHPSKKEIALCYTAPSPIPPSVFRQKLLSRLPKYMLPTLFRHLDQMPENPNGKINRLYLLTSISEPT
jgi:D-alanine--poly(phosphoribitol) ligase subunit 1